MSKLKKNIEFYETVKNINEEYRKGKYYYISKNVALSKNQIKLGAGITKYFCDKKISQEIESYNLFDISQYNFPALVKKQVNKKFVVGLATMPSRAETLKKVICKILPQVDQIIIYLNNFDSVPEFLENKKIKTYRSQDLEDLRDNGKFFGLKDIIPEETIYFTIDDDIDYPYGYFNHMAKKIEFYNYKAVIGVHGVIYPKHPKSFFERIVFHFDKELSHDVPSSIVGTGTMAFPGNLLSPLIALSTIKGMADLLVGEELKKHSIPLITIARPKNWLKEYEREDKTDTIYYETKNSHLKHSQFLNHHSPWGIQQIQDCINTKSLSSKIQPNTQNFQTLLLTPNKLNTDEDNKSKLIFLKNGELSILNNEFYRTSAIRILLAKLKREKSQNTIQHTLETSIQDLFHHYKNENISEIEEHILVEDLQHYLTQCQDFYTNFLFEIYKNNNVDTKFLIIESFKILPPENLIKIYNSTILSTLSLSYILELEHLFLESGYSLGHLLLEHLELKDENKKQHLSTMCASEIFNNKNYLETLKNIIELKTSIKDKRKLINKLLNIIEINKLNISCEAILLFLNSSKTPASCKVRLIKIIVDREWCEKIENIKNIDRSIRSEESFFDSLNLPFFIAETKSQYQKNTSLNLSPINDYNRNHNIEEVILKKTSKFIFKDLKSSCEKCDIDFGLCSVIITSYNSHDTLQYAYDSICNQSYGNIEIIIVDDCSTDNTIESLKISNKTSTKIVKNTTNKGPYESRNIALEIAQGSYIAIQDADDWSHPQRLEFQIKSIVKTNKVASYTHHIRLSQDGHLKLENSGEYIGHGPMTSLFKMTVFNEIGLFDSVRTRGDMEFKNRIINYYNDHSIENHPGILLFSLDWFSNSKKHTNSIKKKSDLAFYKRKYSISNKNLLGY